MTVANKEYHPEAKAQIDALKDAFNAVAAEIEKIPAGRRRAVALTNLETASMWATKALAIGDQ